MKTSKKVMIIVASASVFVGLFISLGALIAMNFDFSRLNSVTFVTNTYSVEEAFSNVSVDGAECDVRLLLSEDGSSKVVCKESDRISHSVAVNSGTLTVERHDDRRWYEHIGIYWGKMEIVIYLPQSEYEALYVKNMSGNITIPKDFSFTEAEVQSTSGNVSFKAAVQNALSAKTVSGELYVGDTAPKSLEAESTSGDVTVASVKVETEVKAKTVSGDVELSGIECQNAAAESTSGDVTFSGVYASEKMNIKSVSGDVELLKCDADSLWIKTTSGDASGTLLTEKIFITDTTSGDISVPGSVTGGKCEVKTTSGDIRFKISE